MNKDFINVKKPKLVLHFDARNTIFVADKFSRISIEWALNTYISGVVWGEISSANEWKCHFQGVSLSKPFPNSVSIYKYTERKIVRTPDDRKTLRNVMGDFTSKPEGLVFRPLYLQHLDLMRWHESECCTQDDLNLFTVSGADGQLYHYILPAFFQLIHNLHSTGRDYLILIRTYGLDAEHILRAVQAFSDGRHPQFPTPLRPPLAIDPRVHKLLRESGDKFVYRLTGAGISADNCSQSGCGEADRLECCAQSERDIYARWNSLSGVVAVVDDFPHWLANDYHYSAAKPFWFEPEDPLYHHIFFDDNIRTDESDAIVNLRRLEKGSQQATCLSPEDSRQYENVFFVQTDLLASISDREYFLKRLEECEEGLEAGPRVQ